MMEWHVSIAIQINFKYKMEEVFLYIFDMPQHSSILRDWGKKKIARCIFTDVFGENRVCILLLSNNKISMYSLQSPI